MESNRTTSEIKMMMAEDSDFLRPIVKAVIQEFLEAEMAEAIGAEKGENWIPLRGFLVDGKTDAAVKMFKEGLKAYPLSKAANPPAMEFISCSKVPFNTVHANNFEFYEELDHVIQKEPVDFLDPELRGLAASIGLRKNQKFAPDERMKKILTDAVAAGNALAHATEPMVQVTAGNDQVCVGGLIFDWSDEYWKGNNVNMQVGGPDVNFQGGSFAGGCADEAGYVLSSSVPNSQYGSGQPNSSGRSKRRTARSCVYA